VWVTESVSRKACTETVAYDEDSALSTQLLFQKVDDIKDIGSILVAAEIAQ